MLDNLVIGVAAGNETLTEAIKDQVSNENEGAARLVKKVIKEAVKDMQKDAKGKPVSLIDIKISYEGAGILEGKSVIAVALGKVENEKVRS